MSSGILKTGVSQAAQEWWCRFLLIRVAQTCQIGIVVSTVEMNDWSVYDKGEVVGGAEVAVALARRPSIANLPSAVL